ncbi:MAG: T9SS type A sorting domain-containing protein [Bacteroidia bacterium]|nr:T9SS type A sorting domain-containing protein [Bacteroidota bacterium]MBP9084316.1 T9SS type A sorting domain-containing protein [Bacteroidia bacterium]
MLPLPLSLIPNPVKDFLTIQFSDQFHSPIDEIYLYNSKGEKILSHPLNKNEFRLDVSQLSAGTYFIKIKNRPLMKPVSFIKL